MSNEEKLKTILGFKKDFLEDMLDIDPKYFKCVDKKFWESLVSGEDNKHARKQTPKFN